MAVHSGHGLIDPTLQGIHVPYQFIYANAAARTGATGFVATDVGKLARQTDDNTLWMLTATTPTWLGLGAASPPAAHASSHHSGGSDPLALGSLAGTLTDGQHGARGGGTLHAAATGVAAGFMPAADKAKLDLLSVGSARSVAGTNVPNTYSDDQTFDGGANITSVFRIPPVVVSADYTFDQNDVVVYVADVATAAPRTITLQSAALVGAGAIVIIKDTSGGAGTDPITVATFGSETINGASFVTMSNDYEALWFQSDGADWWIIAVYK